MSPEQSGILMSQVEVPVNAQMFREQLPRPGPTSRTLVHFSGWRLLSRDFSGTQKASESFSPAETLIIDELQQQETLAEKALTRARFWVSGSRDGSEGF